MNATLRSILSFAFVLAILIGASVWIQSIPQEQIQNLIRRAGIFGPIVYILVQLMTFIIAPVSGTPVSFIGFYLYKENVVILSYITASLSAVINYWIARLGGQPLVKRLAGETGWNTIRKMTENYGYKTLIIARIFQGGLHDFISYAGGIVGLDFRKYLIYSLLSMIPGSVLQYYLASKASGPWGYTAISWIMATTGIGIVIVLTWLNNRIKNKSATKNE